jgi:hypothetical protein
MQPYAGVTADAEENLYGSTFQGHYRIEAKLGEGGMFAVPP